MPGAADPENGTIPRRRRPIWPWVVTATLLLLLGGAVWLGLTMKRVVSDVLAAEDRLQAVKLVCELAGEYVERSDYTAWPSSWEDLERLPPRERRFAWPADAAKVRALVEVDFGDDLAELLKQDPSRFNPIRPPPGRAQYPHSWELQDLRARIQQPPGRTPP